MFWSYDCLIAAASCTGKIKFKENESKGYAVMQLYFDIAGISEDKCNQVRGAVKNTRFAGQAGWFNLTEGQSSDGER
jgi:hypothetical protein